MDVSRVLTNKSESVANFFQQPGIGYYIPLYQHEYSWDPDNQGMILKGTNGCTPTYLTPELWNSDDLKSIEHITPQNPEDRKGWNSDLYEDDNYQKIGNLTILLTQINISISNRGWVGKYIYYQHLAETDLSELDSLASEAQNQGIELAQSSIDLLKKAKCHHHIAPVVNVGINGKWDKDLVDKRSETICELLWDYLWEWFIK